MLTVRLVRPRIKNFMIARIVCMPEIQLASWNPTRTLADIFASIRRVLTAHGEVDQSEPEVNDTDGERPPYTALEFQLLRLTMLTGIAPRVVSVMADSEAIRLFAPKVKSKEQEARRRRRRSWRRRRRPASLRQPVRSAHGRRLQERHGLR